MSFKRAACALMLAGLGAMAGEAVGAASGPLMRITNAGKTVTADPPRVVDGESFRFSVGYLGVIGARAAVNVEKQGETARVITADVENTALLRWVYRIRDRFQSVIEHGDGRTMTTRLWQDENGAHRYREEVFFEDRVVTVERSPAGERTRNVPVKSRPLDPLSSLFWLRGQRLDDGDVLSAPVFANHRVFDAHVTVAGREPVVALGRTIKAIRLRAQFFRDKEPVEGVHGTFWVSDDEKRIPLKAVADTTYGRVSFTLERTNQ